MKFLEAFMCFWNAWGRPSISDVIEIFSDLNHFRFNLIIHNHYFDFDVPSLTNPTSPADAQKTSQTKKFQTISRSNERIPIMLRYKRMFSIHSFGRQLNDFVLTEGK